MVLGVLLMAPLAVAQSNPDGAGSSSPSDTLQPLSAFTAITDDTQRARALFAEIGKVLQHPRWHLAPAEMAWEGKSLTTICDQIKDQERNGGKTLAELGEHMANDALVAYGWRPPAHLEPAPGDQQQFGQLFHACLEAGAHCP
jgi:hypothetical protein